MLGKHDFLSDLPKILIKTKAVNRFGGRLQSGTSAMYPEKDFIRENICNDFFNPCYVVSGSGFYINENGKQFRFSPGCLIFRFAGRLHHQRHDCGSPYMDKYLALPAQFESVLHECGMISYETPVTDIGEHIHIAEGFHKFEQRLERAMENEFAAVMSEMFSFCCVLLSMSQEKRPHFSEIMQAAEVLGRDFKAKVDIAELAKKCGMEQSNFRRLFSLYLNMSPAKYRSVRRLERVRSLLASPDHTIKEIAEETGYPDVYTFSHQFKHLTGISPGRYRKDMFYWHG